MHAAKPGREFAFRSRTLPVRRAVSTCARSKKRVALSSGLDIVPAPRVRRERGGAATTTMTTTRVMGNEKFSR